MVDAAVSLQELGHKVTIFTSHCDKTHCFEEARDGTLDVRVRGYTLIPHSIFGRFSILCAILRQLHLVLNISAFTNELKNLDAEIFFFDQLSACIPLLRHSFPRPKILFYCHFPDKLLARRGGLFKTIYRWPFDWIESWSTGASDVIVVNSNFTKSVFGAAFPGLSYRSPRVVYPCIDVEEHNKTVNGEEQKTDTISAWAGKKTFLSINRFERKKGVDLALRAYARLSDVEKRDSLLIIAGGYDRRISENVSCHKSLQDLATSLDLVHATFNNAITAMSPPPNTHVIFLLSVPTALKSTLLQSCTLLVYTPANEHFGIVPLEAMMAGKPVLAANTGGPKETVIDDETGWLRDVNEVEQWSDVMRSALKHEHQVELQEMGQKGRQRVMENFSKSKMAQRFNEIFEKMLAAKTRPIIMDDREILVVLGIVLVFGFVGICMGGGILAWWSGYIHRDQIAAYALQSKEEL